MSKLTQRLKAHRFATLAFGIALLGVLAGVVVGWSGNPNYHASQTVQTLEPTITTMTSALRILGSERSSLGNSSILVAKLQNTSEKNIKAYTIASGKTWMTRSYFLTEESIAPGAIENQFIPLSTNSSQDFRITFDTRKEFTITAVLFADGTGDGVPRYVSMLADQLAGTRDAATRILPCLRGLSLTSGAKQELALTACEAEALRIPIKRDGKSSDYEGGVQNAQREIMTQLNDIKEKLRTNDPAEAADRQDRVTRLFQRLTNSLH